jgi:hypothetical protein
MTEGLKNDKQYKSGYVLETVGLNENEVRREKITRIYNENKKNLSRTKILSVVKDLVKTKKKGQKVVLRIYTDAGWRDIRTNDDGDFDWKDEEDYMRDTKNPNARPYKKVFFMDLHALTNK